MNNKVTNIVIETITSKESACYPCHYIINTDYHMRFARKNDFISLVKKNFQTNKENPLLYFVIINVLYLQLLLFEATGDSKYSRDVKTFLKEWAPGGSVQYTPGGLAWRLQWGSLRYSGKYIKSTARAKSE